MVLSRGEKRKAIFGTLAYIGLWAKSYLDPLAKNMKTTIVILLLAIMPFGQGSQRRSENSEETDRPGALEFLHALKRCVADENRSCVASMVNYPIGLSNGKEGAAHKELILQSSEELIRHFDEVFPPVVRKALSEQADDKLTFDWGRVYRIGDDHQIWFERVKGEGFRVTAIGVAKYHLAGIEDAVAAENFFRDLQRAVQASDRRWVCSVVDYPITVIINGHQVKIADARQMSRSYDLVFNATVRNAIMQQNPSLLRANWRGLIVGDGEVWFTKDGNRDVFRITAINP
jgi:hypothetical protein